MTISSRLPEWKKAEGSVVIEMALILPILVILLTASVFWARIFWYYGMAQKAAHDAARFLSTATPAEMQTIGNGGGEAPAAGVARWIVVTEGAQLQPVMYPLWIYVECGVPSTTGGYISYGNCGAAIPQMVRVRMTMDFRDTFFPEAMLQYFGYDGIRFEPDVTMRYAGN